MENCKKCGLPLAVILIKDNMEYHIICAPEDVFQAWLDKYRGLDDKV